MLVKLALRTAPLPTPFTILNPPAPSLTAEMILLCTLSAQSVPPQQKSKRKTAELHNRFSSITNNLDVT